MSKVIVSESIFNNPLSVAEKKNISRFGPANLEKLAASRNPAARYEAARNAKTPKQAIQKLLNDKNVKVATAARVWLQIGQEELDDKNGNSATQLGYSLSAAKEHQMSIVYIDSKGTPAKKPSDETAAQYAKRLPQLQEKANQALTALGYTHKAVRLVTGNGLRVSGKFLDEDGVDFSKVVLLLPTRGSIKAIIAVFGKTAGNEPTARFSCVLTEESIKNAMDSVKAVVKRLQKGTAALSDDQESISAATDFLDVDGHFNLAHVQSLNEKVSAAIAKFAKANPTAKPSKPEIIYCIPRKAKPVKYSKSLEAKKDLKYMTARAIKVVSVKRITEAGALRNLPILSVYDKAVVGAPLATLVKQAVSALTKHYNKALKTKASVTDIRGKNRVAADADFAASTSLLKALLEKAGVKAADMILSKGMMGGQTLLIKVGKENVVSVSKADLTRFRAALKASKEVAE